MLSLSSKTFSPSFAASGDAPCSTILPLKPAPSAGPTVSISAMGVKTTGSVPEVTVPVSFASSSLSLISLNSESVSISGAHETSNEKTSSMSVPRIRFALTDMPNPVRRYESVTPSREIRVSLCDLSSETSISRSGL